MKEVSTLTKALVRFFYQLRYNWYFDSSCDGDGVNEDKFVSTNDFRIDYKVANPSTDDTYYGYITIQLKNETFTEEDLKKSLDEIEEAIERDHKLIRTYINPTGEMLIQQLFVEDSYLERNKSWRSKFKYFGPNEVKTILYPYHFEDVENMNFYGYNLYLLGGMKESKIRERFMELLDFNDDFKYEAGEGSMNFKYPGIYMERKDFGELYQELCKRYHEDYEEDEDHEEYEKKKEKELMSKYEDDKHFHIFQEKYPEPFHFSYSEYESLSSNEKSYYMHLGNIQEFKNKRIEKEKAKKFVEEWIDKVEYCMVNLDEVLNNEMQHYSLSPPPKKSSESEDYESENDEDESEDEDEDDD